MRFKPHSVIFFGGEKHILATLTVSSRDKAYPEIRREAKLAVGAPGMLCSRKEVTE